MLIAASSLTSLLTASAGIGGGMVMIALMSYVVPAAALIPVHGAVQFGSNIGRTGVLRHHVDWVRFAAFSIGAFIGAAVGAAIAVRLPNSILLSGLGLFVILSVWVPLKRLAAVKHSSFALIGAITTFLGMFFGATGPINAALLSNSFNNRQVLVGTLAAIMSAQHGFKIIGFAIVGFVFWPWLPLIGAMILSGFMGTLCGSHILHRLPETIFRRLLKIVLTVLALDMIYRGLGMYL